MGAVGDNAGGGGVELPFDIGELIGSIDGAIDGWYAREGGRREGLAESDCLKRIEVETYLTERVGFLSELDGKIDALEEAGLSAVSAAIAAGGKDAAGYRNSSVMSFGKYLATNGYLPMPTQAQALFAIFAGPFGALSEPAWWGWLNSHVQTPPSGRTDQGVRIDDGVYWLAGTQRIQGPHIVDAWEAWKLYAAENAEPTNPQLRPWRVKLARAMAERDRLNASWAEIEAEAERLRPLCDAEREWEREQAERAADFAREAELARLLNERQGAQLDAAADIGGDLLKAAAIFAGLAFLGGGSS